MTGTEWQEERRRNDSLVIELMQEIKGKVDGIDDRLTQHANDDARRFDAFIGTAFPDGDPHGHRAVHEAWIREMEDRHKLRQSVIEKLTTGGVWACLVALTATVWYWLKGHI